MGHNYGFRSLGTCFSQIPQAFTHVQVTKGFFKLHISQFGKYLCWLLSVIWELYTSPVQEGVKIWELLSYGSFWKSIFITACFYVHVDFLESKGDRHSKESLLEELDFLSMKFKHVKSVSILTSGLNIVPFSALSCTRINICLLKWLQLASTLQLVATICNPRLIGVEMTCVSARFGEPIKDGLSSQCRTEGERKTADSRQSESGQIKTPFF